MLYFTSSFAYSGTNSTHYFVNNETGRIYYCLYPASLKIASKD